MHLTADISGNTHELEINQDESRVVAEIDGRRYEIEARLLRDGLYLLLADHQVFECHADRVASARDSFEVTVGNRSYIVALTDPKRLRGAAASGAHASGTAQITAPMPGKVVRVLVEVGAEVETGAGIVVVEAMKMQNEMKSPKAGKVTTINVAAGTTVNAGDVLAVIE